MTELSHFDVRNEFSGDEAAALIVGLDPNEPGVPLHRIKPSLDELKEGHRVAIALATSPRLTRESFVQQRAMKIWAHALFSVKLNFYAAYQPATWFHGPEGEFGAQKFERAELVRWLAVNGVKSVYNFSEVNSPISVDAKSEIPTPQQGAAPADVEWKSKEVHRAKRRVGALDAVIESAECESLDPNDWQSVWAALVKLATSKIPPAPLIGYVDGEGVKYQGHDKVEFLTKDALRKRYGRRRPRAPASARMDC